MTSEEKLEKVEELIAARDEITAELLVLMGEPVDDEEVEEEEEEKPPRKFSVCGKAGHTAQSCARNKPETFGFNSKEKGGCSECGSPSRHKKTCSKASRNAKNKPTIKAKPFVPTEEVTPVSVERSNGRTILDKPLRLTEQEFKDVQVAIIDGLTISEVGFSYPHVELSEIRKVTDSLDYEDYLSK